VRAQRPGTDGKYSFVDLPPGDYVLAAVTDMEPDAWRDSDFLRSLVASGVQVTIAEGEQKTQDLRIGRAIQDSEATARTDSRTDTVAREQMPGQIRDNRTRGSEGGRSDNRGSNG
jgi:hypothetical protein